MTFAAILSAVYDDCNYAASPATVIVTRVKRYVNEGIRDLLLEPGLERLADSDQPATFDSVASTFRYVMPESIAVVRHISERTNDLTLGVMDLGTFRRVYPDPSSFSGTPTHYVPIGRVAVDTQPSDASSIFVKSSSASDTGQTAYIEGLITGNYQRTASVQLNGTTAANLSSAISTFTKITDFYLSASAVGTVTLHEDSGAGTELARITIGATRPRYYAVYLAPTPAAVVTYYVDYRRETLDLVNDTDEPPMITDAHPMLVAYAVMREAEKTANMDLVSLASARYQKMLNHLKYQTQTLADELPVSGRGVRVGRSRLGADFPADYYVRG